MRLYLSHTGIDRGSIGSFEGLGWELIVNKVTPAGDEATFRDHWEVTLLEILRHANDYSDTPIQWRREQSGEPIDLYEAQPAYDASARYTAAVKVAMNPDGAERLCFNLFDDGRYRFTLEQVVKDGPLSAWVAQTWSSEHMDLAEAEEEARAQFSWFNHALSPRT